VLTRETETGKRQNSARDAVFSGRYAIATKDEAGMNWPASAVIGLISIIGTATITGWMFISGLARGVVYSKRVAYSRADDPSNFWFYISAYAVMFLCTAGLLTYFAIDLWLCR